MEIQNQVSRILRDNLARLRDVLDGAVSQGVGSLGQVADRVCEAFDFRDGRGRWQRASCCRALSDLQAAGHVSLPAGQLARGVGGRARVLPHPVAPAVDVPGTVGAVVGLTLVLVETGEQRRVWNTLMAHEHPRGAGPFVGPQLRYLVGSAHGWLGGVGFAASARRLRARDAWVGWDDTGRRAHLHRVLGLVPAAGAPRRCVPQPGLPRAGPGRPGGRRRLRGSVWLSPLAAGDVRRRDRTDGGERARGQLGSGGRNLRSRSRGPQARGAGNAQGGVYVCLGAGVAHPPRGARSGRGAAGGWRRSRRRGLGGPRVRRGAVGRRASERAAGTERAANGRVSDARHHRRRPTAPAPWSRAITG